ncbi:MAG: hypothetical protein HYV09_23780 [Deltaproteobacteria bacterium]|nr:hypothetical protein [Deltaproteobacteria bacterium]
MIRKLLGLVVVAVGCNSTGVGNPPNAPDELSTQESELVSDGGDGNRAGDGASSLVSIPLLALKTADQLTTSDGAAAVGEWSRVAFQPTSCVTSTRAANVVTWTFTDCQGPFGLAQLSGKLIATYTARAPSSLEVVIKSEGLKLASAEGVSLVRADVSIDATAILTITATGAQNIRWQGLYTVTLPAKRIDHQAAYELTKAAECIQLGGTATTTLNDARGKRGVTTTLTGYERCGVQRACPNSGTLTIDANPGDFWVTIEFLGGQAIEVASSQYPEPRTIVKGLRCMP